MTLELPGKGGERRGEMHPLRQRLSLAVQTIDLELCASDDLGRYFDYSLELTHGESPLVRELHSEFVLEANSEAGCIPLTEKQAMMRRGILLGSEIAHQTLGEDWDTLLTHHFETLLDGLYTTPGSGKISYFDESRFCGLTTAAVRDTPDIAGVLHQLFNQGMLGSHDKMDKITEGVGVLLHLLLAHIDEVQSSEAVRLGSDQSLKDVADQVAQNPRLWDGALRDLFGKGFY